VKFRPQLLDKDISQQCKNTEEHDYSKQY